MSFFSKPATRQSAVDRIEEAKNLLPKAVNDATIPFLQMLTQRVEEFETALSAKNLSADDEREIIKQYNRFANTLYHCVQRPKSAAYYIEQYLKPHYYPVGIEDKIEPEPGKHNLLLTLTAIGAATIISSIPAFVFNPIAGISLLSIGIILLLPSLFALLMPDSPDTFAKKMQEKILFQDAAMLSDPTLFFVEPAEPVNQQSFLCIN